MIFLPGTHLLTAVFNITSVNSFTMEGIRNETVKTGVPLLDSRIICTNSRGGLLFRNSSDVFLHRISIENCGTNMTFLQGKLIIHAAVAFTTSQNINFSQVVINNSIGYGLHVNQWFGSFEIYESAFMHSHPSKEFDNVNTGNVHFWFENDGSDNRYRFSNASVNLAIRNSWIMHGVGYNTNHHRISRRTEPFGNGLTLCIVRPLVLVSIVSVVFVNNTTPLGHGGNIAIKLTEFGTSSSRVVIDNSSIVSGTADKGGGLAVLLKIPVSDEIMSHIPYRERNIGSEQNIIAVTNTVFESNCANISGGAFYLKHYETPQVVDYVMKTINFRNCQFTGNYVNNTGAAVMIVKHKLPNCSYSPHLSPMLAVAFDDCNFTENELKDSDPREANEDGILSMFSEEKVAIRNSKFIKNKGTPISLTASNLILEQFNLFEGNSGVYGGAIKICDQALLFLKRGTHVKFERNRAVKSGGAIYTEQQCLNAAVPCFFQPDVNNISAVDQLVGLIRLDFINNRAGIAGHAIYGGSVDDCFTFQQFSIDNEEISYFNSYAIYNRTFYFSTPEQPSLVTSDPYGICKCNPTNNSTSCSSTTNITIYPGKKFTISASAIGQTHGSVPALLCVQNTNTNDSITQIVRYDNRSLQTTTSVLCQTMTIAVFSRETSLAFVVLIQQSYPANQRSNYYKIPKHEISVTLESCPWLFELLNTSNQCDCIHLLLNSGIECDINSESFHRADKGLWIGCADYNSSYNAKEFYLPTCKLIALYKFCDQEYCGDFTGKLSTRNISNLCREGRGGVMCGSCIDGYSLALGPQAKCVEDCQLWKTFLMLFVFVLAGILIIVFLTVFNTTTSEGTIGGLIFYANFVNANHNSFFPTNERSTLSSFLMIFVAWLNLDLGFEVCFYQGMDAYQKQWLEFGFILYLLFLEVSIIFLCHRFIFFTRFIGRNAVHVLSTVILLAYPKLVCNCANILQHALVHLSDNTKRRVWTSDGNIVFLQGKHIPLAVMAILLAVIITFLSFCLLFIQCLQRKSNWFVLRWVVKLRPFFDSFTGPCRDNYRFWPGLLLFIRLALYSAYAVLDAHSKLYTVTAFCIVIFILACVSPHGVYKKWPLNILEFSFFLNLGLLSGLVVTLPKVPTPMVFTYPSVAIAMMTFLGMLMYHGGKRVMSTRSWRRFSAPFIKDCQRLKGRKNVIVWSRFQLSSDVSRDGENAPLLADGASNSVQFREPLLQD